MPDPTLSKTLIEQTPNILYAFAFLLTSAGALVSIVRNGKKVKEIDQKTNVVVAATADAASKAAVAATKAAELHDKTDQISEQAQTIKEQTDGQLSLLMQRANDMQERNEALHEMLTKIVAIMSAREGKPAAVRSEDMNGSIDLRVSHVDDVPADERRQQPDRRKSDEKP
jgi:hypothetical protein